MSTARQHLERTFTTGEIVPCSGFYVAGHGDRSCSPRTVVLLSGAMFPTCPGCDEDAKFELREQVPDLRDDPDVRDP